MMAIDEDDCHASRNKVEYPFTKILTTHDENKIVDSEPGTVCNVYSIYLYSCCSLAVAAVALVAPRSD